MRARRGIKGKSKVERQKSEGKSQKVLILSRGHEDVSGAEQAVAGLAFEF